MSKKLGEESDKTKELQAFAEAQHQTIIELNKKIIKLEEEKRSLEDTVKDLPTIVDKFSTGIGSVIPQSQLIAEVQLHYLKLRSDKSELTYEEAKKVEIYTKILESHQKKEKERVSKNVSNDDLLNIVSGDER